MFAMCASTIFGERKSPPRTLVGVLQCVHVRTLNYDRYSILGIGVDPLTLELIGP